MPDLAQLTILVQSNSAKIAKLNMDRMALSAGKADLATKKLGITSARTGGLMGILGGGIAKVAAQMLLLVAAFASLAGLVAGIRIMAKFEETIAVLGGVTGATTKQLEELTRVSREMGATTRFTATQAGEGLLFLARAGFEVNEAIAALPATLNLAIAGQLELGQAADFASNILAQFTLQATEMDRVANILVNTANSSNTTVLQLAEALKFAGPVAGKLGISLEETAAALGTMGNAGIQASLGGTQLRNILSKLVLPTGRASTAIKSLGLNLDDIKPGVNSLTEIFERFAGAGLGAEEALAIFGLRGVAGALQLTAAVKGFRDLGEANDTVNDVAQKMADIMNRTLIGKMKALLSVTQELVLQFGDSGFVGVLKSALGFITDMGRSLAGMSSSIEGNVAAVEGATNALRALMVIVGVFVASKLLIFLLNLKKAWEALTLAVLAFRIAMLNPVTATVTILGALAAAFVLIAREVRAADAETKLYLETLKELRDITTDVADINSLLTQAQGAGDTARVINLLGQKEQKTLQALEAIVKARAEGGLDSLNIATRSQFKGEDGIFNTTVEPLLATIKELQLETDVLGGKLDRTFTDRKSFQVNPNATGVGLLGDSFEFPRNEELTTTTSSVDAAEVVRRLQGRLLQLREEQVALRTELRAGAPVLEKQNEGMAVLGAEFENARRAILRGRAELAGFNDEQKAQLERFIELREARAKLVDAGVDRQAIDATLAALEEELELRDAVLKKMKEQDEQRKKDEQVAKQFGDTVADSFKQFVTGAETASEAMRNLAQAIAEMVIQQAIIGPLAAGITGSFGGTFASALSGAEPAASGTVLNGPTLIPQRGRNVLAGEAGPEAVLPLARNAQGVLGIEGSGGGTVVHAPVTVVTRDAASFGRNRNQVAAAFQRIGRRAAGPL